MGDSSIDTKPKIISTQSLGDFFFEKLSFLNKKSLCPVPAELIFYSSRILEENYHSNSFFELSEEGRVKNKILGTKLLEATNKTSEEKKRILKEVGDSCLLISGYFHESLNKKIIDESYYYEIGKRAYLELDNYVHDILNIKYFYKYIATGFENLSRLLHQLHAENKGDPYGHLLLNTASEKDMLSAGVIPSQSEKAS